MANLSCPKCGSELRQVKAGLNKDRQQYRCGVCGRRYVPDEHHVHPSSLKDRAAVLRQEGRTLGEIGLELGVTQRTLSNWFRKLQAERISAEKPADLLEVAASLPKPSANLVEPRLRTSNTTAKRRVTIHDVAERAGVAASTVSNYLNFKGRIGDDARIRIKESVDALHFTPSALTRAIRKGRTRILGVQTFGLWNFDEGVGYSIIPPILTGINRKAAEAGFEILLYTTEFPSVRDSGARYRDGHIDGLLWVAPAMPEPVLESTAEAGLPVVALLTRHVSSNIGYVNADNIGGTRSIVEHLLSLGRNRIGYYSPLYASNYIDRYESFQLAMADAKLECDPGPMKFAIRSGEPWAPSRVDQGVSCLVDMAETLDAIILPDDSWAAWAINALQKRGVRVPEDVAVVGFNDVPDAANAGITTVRQPFRQIGRSGVECLMALIDGAPVSECRVTLPTELVVRSSTMGSR